MKRKGDGILEDQKIIALLFERSEQGMTELIAKYGKLLRRIAWNILGNALDAEECANDTYLSVWTRVPRDSFARIRDTGIFSYYQLVRIRTVYAVNILLASSRMLIAALRSLSISFPHTQ